eukprot:12020144-Alexandrium_andersonii.AAC.1
MKGRELEEDAKTCSLDQLLPAQAASSDAPIGMDVGALEAEPADADPEAQELHAAFAVLQR